jgi:hypothetical protein
LNFELCKRLFRFLDSLDVNEESDDFGESQKGFLFLHDISVGFKYLRSGILDLADTISKSVVSIGLGTKNSWNIPKTIAIEKNVMLR